MNLALRSLAARALRLGGALLWVAALIHFAAFSLLRRTVAARLPAEAFAFIWPPFAFSFLLDGILLLPLGFTALYAATGVRRGERWATVLGLATAIVVLTLPVLLGVVMGSGYFAAAPFLTAMLVMVAAGLAMLVPLVQLARDAAGR
jgi:hypothetical protein